VLRLGVDAVQHDVEVAGVGFDFGNCRALTASSTASGWKPNTSLRSRRSASPGAIRSTQSIAPEAGSSHSGSTRSTNRVWPF
jgi:hypothetical protein